MLGVRRRHHDWSRQLDRRGVRARALCQWLGGRGDAGRFSSAANAGCRVRCDACDCWDSCVGREVVRAYHARDGGSTICSNPTDRRTSGKADGFPATSNGVDAALRWRCPTPHAGARRAWIAADHAADAPDSACTSGTACADGNACSTNTVHTSGQRDADSPGVSAERTASAHRGSAGERYAEHSTAAWSRAGRK